LQDHPASLTAFGWIAATAGWPVRSATRSACRHRRRSTLPASPTCQRAGDRTASRDSPRSPPPPTTSPTRPPAAPPSTRRASRPRLVDATVLMRLPAARLPGDLEPPGIREELPRLREAPAVLPFRGDDDLLALALRDLLRWTVPVVELELVAVQIEEALPAVG